MAKKSKVGMVAGIAAAVAGVAAAGAASYYFLGEKDAEKNRKKVAKWAKDMQKDVLKKAKKIKKLDEKAVHAIIDESMSAYKTLKDVKVEDLQRAAAELKTGWEHVAKEVKRTLRKEKLLAAEKMNAAALVVKKSVKKLAPIVKSAVKKNIAVVKKVAAPAKKAPAKKVVVAKKAPVKKVVAKKK